MMRSLHALKNGLRSLIHRQQEERELDDELSFHIEMQTAANIRRGLSPAEARTEALRAFGGVEKAKEQCRESWGVRGVESLGQDLRFGVRSLARYPSYSLVVVLILALGIGANTAIFSAVYGILLRPLPYAEGDRLVLLRQLDPRGGDEATGVSPLEMADYRAKSPALAGLVEHHSMWFNLLSRGEPERVQTGVVSWNYFDILGIEPVLGRTFAPADERHGATPVLVLSYEYWQRSHGGDPAILGRTFQMNDKAHTVVGVLPPVPPYPEDNEVYMPTTACPFRGNPEATQARNARMLTAFARLARGASLERAQSEVKAAAAQMRADHPEDYPPDQQHGATLVPLREELTHDVRPKLMLLLGTVGLVLLVACANAANLALARLSQRQRELALRTALGADRRRLARQLLTESAILGLAGGAAGLLLALPVLRLLTTFAARFTPRANEIEIDGAVLLFTLAASLITGLIFGAAPALTRPDLNGALKDGGERATASGGLRLRNVLVVLQLAVSVPLLVAAGLSLRSLLALHEVDPGFRLEQVLTATLDLDWDKYNDEARRRQFFQPLLERLQAHPEVISAAIGSTFPLNDSHPWDNELLIEGRAVPAHEALPQIDLRIASPDYFSTLGIPILRGRAFTADDLAGTHPVALVNQTLARRYWADGNPIGQRISIDGGENWRTVVGVVGDVKQYGLDQEVAHEVYRPLLQYTMLRGTLVIRTTAAKPGMEKTVRQIIRGVDPEQPVYGFRTLEEVRAESIAPKRLTAVLLGSFAGLALAIAAAGIAGVLAFSVSQRTHEIGIRMALGASRGRVLRMVLGQAAPLILLGLALGLAGALGVTHLLSGLLFGVEPTDPTTFLAVSLLLVSVAAAASLVPARRATEVHPMAALRDA